MLPVKAMKPIVLAKKNLIVSCPKHLSKFIIYNIIYNLFKQCYLKNTKWTKQHAETDT